MEILMTNVSIWGILVLLFTTLQMTIRARLQHNTSELSNFINIFLQKAHLFILHSYKPVTLFALSAFTLFVCYKLTGDKYISLWGSASVGGVISIGIGLLLKPGLSQYVMSLDIQGNSANKVIKTVCTEKNINNTGTLFISLTSLLIVFISYQAEFTWNVYAVLSLMASFAVGASGLLLCMHFYEVVTIPHSESYSRFAARANKLLNNDRFDTLAGALIAAMLLGTTFCQISAFQQIWMPASPVLLPLVLTISGVSISSIASSLSAIYGWKKDTILYLTEKMISALLMIISAFFITQYLLPVSWVNNGIEYTSIQVFYAAQAGVIGGLLTNKVAQGYKFLHRKYFSYLAKKSFKVTMLDSAFHFTMNTLSTLMPVLLIVFSIVLSYQLVGLYGIVIAMVAMLANISTRLTVGR